MFKSANLLTGLAASALLALVATSAMANMPTKHKFDCATCHQQQNAVAGNAFVLPPSKTCIQCHGTMEQLAEKTKPADPHDPNPHASHHYGPNMECTACHAEHKPSHVACNNCHDFKFKQIR